MSYSGTSDKGYSEASYQLWIRIEYLNRSIKLMGFVNRGCNTYCKLHVNSLHMYNVMNFYCRDAEDDFTELIHQRDISTMPRGRIMSETPANYEPRAPENEYSNPLYMTREQEVEAAEKEGLDDSFSAEQEKEDLGNYSFSDGDDSYTNLD